MFTSSYCFIKVNMFVTVTGFLTMCFRLHGLFNIMLKLLRAFHFKKGGASFKVFLFVLEDLLKQELDKGGMQKPLFSGVSYASFHTKKILNKILNRTLLQECNEKTHIESFTEDLDHNPN